MPDEENPRKISRRDALKLAVGAGAVGAGAVGAGAALGLDRVFLGPFDKKPLRGETSRLVDRGIKHDLREALSAKEIEWVRQVIEKYHKPPFRELRDFVPVDGRTHGLAQHVSIHGDPTTGVNYLSWGIRGGGDESDLSRNLNLWCKADLEPDARISKLYVRIDLKQAFGTGLTPQTDQYIDISSGKASIAAEDLKNVAGQVFNFPTADDVLDRKVDFREYGKGGSGFSYYREEYMFAEPNGAPRETILFDIENNGIASMAITRFPHTDRPKV